MKNEETEYLDNLFSRSSNESGESETDFPLMDVPANLTNKLYAITEPSSSTKQSFFVSWPKVTSIAASLLMVVVVFQVYQQQQTLKQLEQAQSDLATALHYLGEANQITRAQMLNSLNDNVKKAAATPVLEIGRDTVLPSLRSLETNESLESETNTPTRTL